MNARAAQVRIYVDADVLGLGKILADLRNDVTYPGDPGAVITSDSGHRAPSRIPTCSMRPSLRRKRSPRLSSQRRRQRGMTLSEHQNA
jgi:hypothetical protein